MNNFQSLTKTRGKKNKLTVTARMVPPPPPPPPCVKWTHRYPWTEAKYMVRVEEDVGDGTTAVAWYHRSRAMEVIRRFGSTVVDDVIPGGYDDDDDDDDELGREVVSLATGALVGGGSAATAARAGGHYETHQKAYEDFCLWYLPEDHAEFQRIKSMQTALEKSDTKFRVTEPCDTGTVLKYLRVMWAPKTMVYTTKSVPKRMFTGRGSSYSMANIFVSSAKYVDEALTGNTRLRAPVIANIMSEKFRDYTPQSANAFDVATVIPRVHEAMFAASFEGRENPYNTGLQRQFWYTMWMMVLACCARRSLFTTFCPRIDQVDVDDAAKDADGFPQYIIIKLEKWKGNRDGRRWQKLKISRNYVDVRFCPVVALCLWLKTLHSLGVTDNGPLFPGLSTGHGRFSRADAEAPLERMTKDAYTSHWRAMCVYVGGGLLLSQRTHAARRTVVKWGARCGEPWMELQNAGRWTSNRSFMVYWQDGEALRRRHPPGARDPINDIWVWVPIQIEAGTSSTSCN